MSGTYTRYTVESEDGNDWGSIWEQNEYEDAKRLASGIGGMVIAQEYEWVDSELVDDFRERSATCADCDSDLDDDGGCPLCRDTTIEGPMHEAEAAYEARR